tara:strand:- start:702 stop:875 length:174 start_codon:yes stop_codon:yes gene_type:complete
MFYDKAGQLIISAIFGLSIALLFYMPIKLIDADFKYNNKCYKLNKYKVKCKEEVINT